MVNVNKKYLDDELEKKIWQRFFKEIKGIQSEKDLKALFSKYFTSSEITLLEKRLGINYCLGQNLRAGDIQRLLNISRTTINFVKRGFQKPKGRQKFSHQSLSSLKISFSSSRRKAPLLPPRGKGRWSFLRNI